jgi:hypothetical protein
MKRPPSNLLELPLEVRAEMALKAAVEKVWEEHAREGIPIFFWHNGKVVEVSAEELRARYMHPTATSDQEIPKSD